MTNNSSTPSSEEIRKKHKVLLYVAPMCFAVTLVSDRLQDGLLADPWKVALPLLALAVVWWLYWRRLQYPSDVFLDARFLTLVLVYVVLFTVAANSRLLSWKSRITGFEKGVRPNFLALNPLGDWHYFFSKAEPVPGDLIVVVLDAVRPALARQLSAELIQLAQSYGAIAVALDFDLTDPRPKVDELFCRAVKAAQERRPDAPMPVLYGRGQLAGKPSRLKIARSLDCLAREDGGHLLAIREWDGKVRAIPVYYDRHQRWQALSLKIAGALDRHQDLPEADIIQFLEPAGGVDVRTLGEVKSDPGLLTDRVVLAGFGDIDIHSTPFGKLPGVVIHAYAAQALRSGEVVRRGSRWTTFPLIFANSYLLLLLYVRRTHRNRILAVATGLSLAITGIAAAAMRWGRLWIEISYPILAIWGFLALLYCGGLRSRRQGTPTASHGP